MAGKIVNTLKYGDKKTKRKLYLMLGILAAGVIGLLVALLLSNLLVGGISVLALLADGIILLNSSFSQKDISMQQVKKERAAKVKKETDEDDYGALAWVAGEKKEKKGKKEKEKAEEEETEEEEAEEEKAEKEKAEKEKKEKEKTEKNWREKEEQTENPLLTYDEKKIKKVMVAYKVKREHVPIMIDYCQAERISQCPAYAWRDAGYVYFLLLEKEPRMVKAALKGIDGIHIRRGINARPSLEYPDMRAKSMVSRLFSDYLPKYYQANQEGYRLEYRKNLYSAAPGIWCTATSVKNLLKLFAENFILDDSHVTGESGYYQDIYLSRILYRDGIYTAEEYRDRVLKTLASLAAADVSEDTFHEYLARIVLTGMLPQEYADYTINRRAKR